MFDVGRNDMGAGFTEAADKEIESFGAAGSKDELLGLIWRAWAMVSRELVRSFLDSCPKE